MTSWSSNSDQVLLNPQFRHNLMLKLSKWHGALTLIKGKWMALFETVRARAKATSRKIQKCKLEARQGIFQFQRSGGGGQGESSKGFQSMLSLIKIIQLIHSFPVLNTSSMPATRICPSNGYYSSHFTDEELRGRTGFRAQLSLSSCVMLSRSRNSCCCHLLKWGGILPTFRAVKRVRKRKTDMKVQGT